MPTRRTRLVDHGRELLGLAVLLGGGLLLLQLGEQLEVWQLTGAWLLLVLAVVLLFRRGFAALVGPVLVFDAVRTARRARHALLRAGYALLLLVVLFLVYTRSFGRDIATGLAGIMDEQSASPSTIAVFVAQFFHTFLVVQFLAVLVLTPAFTAGAIAEEREKGTLPLLLTTDLFNREIVLGKLCSRLGHLVLFLLAGVPILSLLQLLGGVDPALLAAGFSLTLLTALGVGALAMLCSVHCNRPRDAVFLTYVCVAGYQLFTGFFCGVFAVNALDSLPEYFLGVMASGNVLVMYFQLTTLSQAGSLGSDLPWLLLQYLTFHGLLSVVCLGWAMALLRRPPSPGPHEPAPSSNIREVLREHRPPPHPKLGRRSPMVWKECYLERGLQLHPLGELLLSMTAVIVVSIAGTVFFCGVLAWVWEGELAKFTNAFLRVCIPVVATIGMLSLALRAAGTFTSERERQTLDSLLTTDLTASEIILGKFVGSFRQMRNLGKALAVLLGAGILTGGVFPLWGVVEVLVLAVHAVFAVCLGMYCSLRSRTTLRATVATAVVLLLVTVGHWLILLVVTVLCHTGGKPELVRALEEFHAYGLTPPLTQLAFLVPVKNVMEAGTFAGGEERITMASLGVLFYGGGASLLWGLLGMQFLTVTGRGR